jgi:hypothetical protein
METRAHQASFPTSLQVERRSWTTLILFLAIALQISASGQDPRGEDKSGKPQPTEMPFRLYNGNLIVVKGTIGSIEGVNLIFDTGTTPTSISKSLASRLKLSGNREPLQTLSGAIETESFILPHIQVGEFSGNQVRVVAQDFKFMEQSLNLSVGGILGLDVLRSHNFAIDYRKKKIIFTVADTADSIQFERQSPLLTVKAKIDNQDLRLVVDSGTQGLVAFRHRINQPGGSLRPVQGTLISTVAGTPQAKFFRGLVTLGEDSREQTVTIAEVDLGLDNDFDGLLGFAAMGFQRVSFDFERGTLGWNLDANKPSHKALSRLRAPLLGCGDGFDGGSCQLAVEAVTHALHQLNTRLPGWRVIVVPSKQWQTVSAEFGGNESAPAFSNLLMASTYLNAELVFSEPHTDARLARLTPLSGVRRLQWVLAHEYGHIVCHTHEEGRAERAGDYLLRGEMITCD